VVAAPAIMLFFRNERRLERRADAVSVEDWFASAVERVTSLLMVRHSKYLSLNSAISAGIRVTVTPQ
jgi:hypothetical protein